ncbi:hypothetical protein [Streptomyces olivochromogenes]|uniref:Uncharacterized protein n=1 Tax=Streptomyces olivochromogenes TaxID=1963 RepID=A0A250VTF1_STROL|nr:hypothetical protein [Streptomyces olivochromogenes]KUN38300.1 hypothetical protein AQJ27_45200 [Streptomyces olivochromogenes]GAX57250.1 hypothetical protein SO3561_08820 [Streptomyces olivochromogenes]
MHTLMERPGPGVIVETNWGSQATCHACRTFAAVTRDGLLYPHDKPRGEGPCRNQWGAADLASAIARDEQLNEEESALHGRVYQWLIQCKGYQRLGDGSVEECNHPICDQRRVKGLQWTLMGWKKLPLDPP